MMSFQSNLCRSWQCKDHVDDFIPLNAWQELAIQGCSNLEGLQLVDLGSLTYLALSGSPSLTISGLSDLSQLRHLDASGSSRLARQCLSDAADLLQLRGLSLKVSRSIEDGFMQSCS